MELIALSVRQKGAYTLKGDVLTIDMGYVGVVEWNIVIQGDYLFVFAENGDSVIYTSVSESEVTTRPAGEPTMAPTYAPTQSPATTAAPQYTYPQTTSPAEIPTNAPGVDLKKEIIGTWKNNSLYLSFKEDGSLELFDENDILIRHKGSYTLKDDELELTAYPVMEEPIKWNIVIVGDDMFFANENGVQTVATRVSGIATLPEDVPTMVPTYAPAVTEAPTYSPSGSSASEAVAAYNKAVNDAKYYIGGVTLHMLSNASVSIADSAAKKIITAVLANLTTPTDREWKFENGSDSDGRRLSEKLPPSYRDC